MDYVVSTDSILAITGIALKRIRGRRILNPYALFEALKARDLGLEPMPRYR